MPTLTIQLPGLPPVSHILRDETSTVGRMKGNTIVVEDSSVSLTHARITRKNGEYFLKDLNSTNGTEVNGQPVNEAKLRDLDRVKFANIHAQFYMAEAGAPAPQPVPDMQPSVPRVPAPQPPAPSIPAFMQAAPAPAPAPQRMSAAAPAMLSAGPAPFHPSAPSAPLPAPRRRPPTPKRFARGQLVGMVAGGVSVLGIIAFFSWKAYHGNLDVGPSDANGSTSGSSAEKVSPAPNPAQIAAKPNLAAPPTNEQTPPGPAQLIAALRSTSVAERRRAARALHSLGPDITEAVPALRVALKDTDPEVRMWSALSLVNDKCYDKACIPILVNSLQNENPVLRQVACLSLGLIPYDPAEKQTVVAALTETAQKDTDEEARKSAQSALDIIAPDSMMTAGPK
jgi:predicted component of type VI protein secretion system